METLKGRARQMADILMQIGKPCNIIREDSRVGRTGGCKNSAENDAWYQ
jgi:hypothetical protein